MAVPELVFNNKNCFIDITNDDVRIRFADTEVIEGHTFRHIEYGIFAAEPAFEITNADMYDMVVNYRDIVYAVECLNDPPNSDERLYRVIFAYSREISHDFCKLNYINSSYRTSDELNKFYDFSQCLHSVEYGFYRTAKLDHDNLPDNKSALAPIYNRTILPNGRRPWIKLNNHIGIEVEPGIYYFAESGESLGENLGDLPVIDLNTKFSNEYVAAICHSTDIHFSFDSAVRYLAIGKEHFDRLKEIQRLLQSTSYGYYHEYGFHDSSAASEKTEKNESNALSTDDIMDAIKSVTNKDPNLKEVPPSGAIELVEGLGFYDLCIRFERPFFEPVGFSNYDIAYRLGNKLVLGKYKEKEMFYEYHDLRFLSALYVKKVTRLNNGIDYPVIHTIIDCREERLRQVLTPEAYSLYINELNSEK